MVLIFGLLQAAPVRAATYYVDGAFGNNANAGTAPDAAWKDFSNINGRALEAGERLLIKRGSVINQELRVGARGTAEQWAEIGAYGEGARPAIRRDQDIHDRCALISNPDFLRIRGLTVSRAGKGLIVFYSEPGHGGLVIEDCVAHHIEGLYRTDSSGIPEWRDFRFPKDEGPANQQISAGIGVKGPGRDITLRDCEVFQNSWGFFVQGEQVLVDRVYCHHNYTFNTSPHPALVDTTHAVLRDSVFDAAGYHAHAGTMGIMLVNPVDLAIRNCTFRNQPDSGCHDEGGIDFEAGGENCVVENCTFRNNAGAAIEILGLARPQVKNLEIRNSRFIHNNGADKLGPAEIFVWGAKQPAPEVCCSTGTIHDNGCVLLPGVEFFSNQAPATTQWTVSDNPVYATPGELDRAMPLNNPPVVDAGGTLISDRAEVELRGRVDDDGRPAGNKLSARWELLEGPGTVAFDPPAAATCGAVFSAPGDYLLRLVGDDGGLWTSGMVAVRIVPPGVTVVKAWEFNAPLDPEGWTEAGLGTQAVTHYIKPPPTQTVSGSPPPAPGPQNIACISYPVHYVAGGQYILAMENAPEAHLLSTDGLGVPLDKHKTVVLRLQNHTTATRMTLRFVTEADPVWNDAKSITFAVTPDDKDLRDCAVDMSPLPGWTGKLRQLRLDLAGGAPATGTCRIDCIRIDNSRAPPP